MSASAVEIVEYLATRLLRALPGHPTALDPDLPANHPGQKGYSDPEVQAQYNLARTLAAVEHFKRLGSL